MYLSSMVNCATLTEAQAKAKEMFGDKIVVVEHDDGTASIYTLQHKPLHGHVEWRGKQS
jgi:hypothetical protein